MALAHISFAGISAGNAEFYADIGTNRFYRYRIGDSKEKINGLDQLGTVEHQSALFAQEILNPFNSRFLIKIPVSLFAKNRQYLQLYSYADERGRSPAISDAVAVYPQAELSDKDWPLLTQSKQMSMQDNHRYAATFNNCRSTGFSFEESRFSNAMFWDTLLEAAKVLAPIALKAITGLVAPPSGSASPAGTTQAGTAPAPSTEDIMKVLNAVIGAVGQSAPAANTPAPAAAIPPSTAKTLQFSNGFSYRKLNKQASFRNNRSGFARQQIVDGGVLTIPLLASLLGPLLQQAPQLLQVLGDTPIKLLNAKSEADQKKQEEQNKYLSGLLAQHNQNALLQLLANSARLNAQNPPVAISFSNSNQLAISFDASKPVTVNGKQKFVYQANAPVKLLLHVRSLTTVPNRPIPKVIVQLEIKEATSLKLVLEKKYRMKEVFLNSMIELELLPPELQLLPLNTDLLVTASFIWQSKSAKRTEGKSEVHAIYLVQDYFLKGSGTKEAGDLPLSDINKFRVFWNKIWEGSAKTMRRWQTRLDARYYVYYRHDLDSNGRIETKLKVNLQQDGEDASRLIVEGKLKSGLEVSPAELNKLLPEISHFPLLTPQQLQAFRTDDLQKQFNQQAQAHLELKGRKEETGIIWAYPEVAVFKFVLNKVQQADAKGQVTELTEETVYFPCPTSIHFAGLKTA